MPFVTLNGTTVRVQSNGITQKYNEHGLDRERMFDGTMRQIRRGIFRQWDGNTAILSYDAAATLVALLTSTTLPLALTGDLVGDETVAVMPVLISNDPIHTGAGAKRRVVFTLHETLQNLPPDTSAEPVLFWKAGAGFWQDDDMTIPALDGDDIAVWEDQTGNNNHAVMTDGIIGGDSGILRPTRATNDVRFGQGALDTTALHFPDVHLQTTGELMIAVKAADDPPASDGKLHGLPSAGVTLYPSSTGNIHSWFGGVDLDAGDPATDLTEWNVLDEYGSPTSNAVLLNNVVLATGSGNSNPFGVGASRPGLGGLFPNVGSGHFDGWVRHVVFFNAILNATQRLSWYEYLAGLTDEPPLPE